MGNSGTNHGTGPVKISLPAGKEYFTIAEIIEQAQNDYRFECSRTQSKSRYDKIRKKLERTLGDADGPVAPNSAKTYKREIVYDVLSNELCEYFLKLSVDANQEDARNWKSKGRTGKARDASGRAKWATTNIQSIHDVSQTKRTYIGNMAALFSSAVDTGDDMGAFVTAEIEQAKHEIFFQALFDALIDFDVDAYKHDLQCLPNPTDMNPTDAEIEAIARLRDLRNYYSPKVDLSEVLRNICGGSHWGSEP